MSDSGVDDEQIEGYKLTFYLGAATMSELVKNVFFDEDIKSKALLWTFYRIIRYTEKYCKKSLENVYIDEKEFKKFKMLSKSDVKKDTLKKFWFRIRTIKFYNVSPEAFHKHKVFFLTGALALHDFLVECFKAGVSEKYIRQEFTRINKQFLAMSAESAERGLQNA